MNESNINKTLLHTMQPLDLFSERAGDYVKYRPSYPSNAITTIIKGLGETSQLVAADIGAGTGIASHLLADQGVRVIAIEPNTSMREATVPHPLIEFREAGAECTNLPDESVNLVTCFQAFHWFNPESALLEFHRILKPSGRLALIWNEWGANDKFLAEFRDIINKAIGSDRPKEKQRDAFKPLVYSSNFAHIGRYTFIHTQKLDLSGVIGYALSKSFAPRSGSAHKELVQNLQNLHARWADENGIVLLTFRTTVYLAKPQSHHRSKFLLPLKSKLLLKWWRLNDIFKK